MLSRQIRGDPSLMFPVINFLHSSSSFGGLRAAMGLPVEMIDIRSRIFDAPVPGAGLSISAMGTHPSTMGRTTGDRNAASVFALDASSTKGKS